MEHKMKGYIIDENHMIKATDDLLLCFMQFRSNNCIVQQDTFFDGNEQVRISTVFLPFDYSFGRSKTPILFETMVFGGDHDDEMERYHTWEQAETGHRKMCERCGFFKN
jgi:hypothetical protein